VSIQQKDQKLFARDDTDERFRILAETASDAIIVTDETSTILFINHAAEKIFGYRVAEMLGQPLTMLMPEHLRSVHQDGMRRYIQTGARQIDWHGVELPGRHRSGAELSLKISFGEFTEKNQRFFTGIVHDITRLKTVEEELRRAHAELETRVVERTLQLARINDALRAEIAERNRAELALRDSESKYRMLMEQASDGIFIGDMQGNIIEVNTRGCEMLGYTREELLSVNAKDIFLEDELDAQPLRYAELMQGKMILNERRVRHRDGHVLTIEISAKKLEDNRLQAIARDVTERKHMDERLRHNETMSAMGSLVAGVAHEVRNPLFGISSILDAFEARFGDQQEFQRYTTVLQREVNRLSELMQDLLEYGKPPNHKLQPGSLKDVITQALRSCSPLARQLNVELSDQSGLALPSIMMDPNRLPRVFLNLLENALYHSPAGGVVTITTKETLKKDQRVIECAVEDSGPGIKREELSKIFEPFFTRRKGGTGLGLSIVQRIVEEHGGEITASNRATGGAVITVSLPVADSQAEVGA
jgi:PAS domain S-box-containing protein